MYLLLDSLVNGPLDLWTKPALSHHVPRVLSLLPQREEGGEKTLGTKL